MIAKGQRIQLNRPGGKYHFRALSDEECQEGEYLHTLALCTAAPKGPFAWPGCTVTLYRIRGDIVGNLAWYVVDR